jgi:hypothetical protein
VVIAKKQIYIYIGNIMEPVNNNNEEGPTMNSDADNNHTTASPPFSISIPSIVEELATPDSIGVIHSLKFIINNQLTSEAYRDFIKLPPYRNNNLYQATLQNFLAGWKKRLNCPETNLAIFQDTTTKDMTSVPYYSLDVPIIWWLSEPTLLEQIQSHRDKYLHIGILENIEEHLEAVIEDVKVNGLSNLGNTPCFIECVKRTKHKWWPRYVEAVSNDIEPLFIHFQMFSDGFSWKDRVSSKALWNWQMTCSQFSAKTRSCSDTPGNIYIYIC